MSDEGKKRNDVNIKEKLKRNYHVGNPGSMVLSSTSVTSSTTVKSSKNETRSVNSVSCGSLNQVETGTAFAV